MTFASCVIALYLFISGSLFSLHNLPAAFTGVFKAKTKFIVM